MHQDTQKIQYGQFKTLVRECFKGDTWRTAGDVLTALRQKGHTATARACNSALRRMLQEKELVRRGEQRKAAYKSTPALGSPFRPHNQRIDRNQPPPPTPEGVLMLQTIMTGVEVRA